MLGEWSNSRHAGSIIRGDCLRNGTYLEIELIRQVDRNHFNLTLKTTGQRCQIEKTTDHIISAGSRFLYIYAG
jgi:hypothetical protein